MFVYPRLPTERALELLEEIRGLPFESLRGRSQLSHADATFYTAGTPVPEATLVELRDAVRAVVDELGIARSERLGDAAFDQRLPGILHRVMAIVPADAATEGVWSFISLVLLPEAAVWRWPKMHVDRMTGHYRNVFRRLWWRAEILGGGGDDPPVLLGEDQLVAVMERPTIGGERRLARSFCRAVLNHMELRPDAGGGMALMREAAKRLIRFTPFVAMGALKDKELEAIMQEIVGDAARSLHTG
jgi:hypothetical protein